jgi:hypothetical protein
MPPRRANVRGLADRKGIDMEQSTDTATELRERMTEALNTTLVTPEGEIKASPEKWDRHDRHNFLHNCAVCQGNVPAIVAAATAIRDEERDALKATVDRVKDAVMNQSSTKSLTEAILVALDIPQS